MNNIRYMASLYGEAKKTEKDLKLKVTKKISDKSNKSDKIINKDNIISINDVIISNYEEIILGK